MACFSRTGFEGGRNGSTERRYYIWNGCMARSERLIHSEAIRQSSSCRLSRRRAAIGYIGWRDRCTGMQRAELSRLDRASRLAQRGRGAFHVGMWPDAPQLHWKPDAWGQRRPLGGWAGTGRKLHTNRDWNLLAQKPGARFLGPAEEELKMDGSTLHPSGASTFDNGLFFFLFIFSIFEKRRDRRIGLSLSRGRPRNPSQLRDLTGSFGSSRVLRLVPETLSAAGGTFEFL